MYPFFRNWEDGINIARDTEIICDGISFIVTGTAIPIARCRSSPTVADIIPATALNGRIDDIRINCNVFNLKSVVLFARGRSNVICLHEDLRFSTVGDKIVQNDLLQIPCIARLIFNTRDLIIIPGHVCRRDPQVEGFNARVPHLVAISWS